MIWQSCLNRINPRVSYHPIRRLNLPSASQPSGTSDAGANTFLGLSYFQRVIRESVDLRTNFQERTQHRGVSRITAQTAFNILSTGYLIDATA